MRKLAIVTAALALVAVMIAFPAPTAWAVPENEVVILKCSESITTTPRGVLVSAAFPKVVVYQSSARGTPIDCEANDINNKDSPNSCAVCLKRLLLNHGCSPQAAFLVNDRVTEIGDGQQNPNHPSDDSNLNNFSIEKYVFSGCDNS